MKSRAEQNSTLPQWVPMPRYLLRRFIVRRLIRQLRPNNFIEIGAAAGEMAEWIGKQAIPGVAVEISPQALPLLQSRLANQRNVEVFPQDAQRLDRQTDLLLSMEVIEHLADDAQALRDWFQLIRPGGYLVLSAPAGKRLCSAEDVLVGHYRRYERHELFDKLESAGFQQTRILSYGFPLGIALKRIRNVLAQRQLRGDARTRQQRTEASGVERRVIWLRWILNSFIFLPFHLIQMPFLRLDWTDGYIAVARKPCANGLTHEFAFGRGPSRLVSGWSGR